jgi:hypothetical protein
MKKFIWRKLFLSSNPSKLYFISNFLSQRRYFLGQSKFETNWIEFVWTWFESDRVLNPPALCRGPRVIGPTSRVQMLPACRSSRRHRARVLPPPSPPPFSSLSASVPPIQAPFHHCRQVELSTTAYLVNSPPPPSNQTGARHPPSASGEHLPHPNTVSHVDSNLSPPWWTVQLWEFFVDLSAPVTLSPLSVLQETPVCYEPHGPFLLLRRPP